MRGDVELALDARAEVGESPVWDVERGELIWVDIPRCLVQRLEPASGRTESLRADQPVGAVAPRAGGGLVLALRDGFGLLDRDDAEVRLVRDVERDDPRTRMNDGACDSTGRFWAGTMALDMVSPVGALYRLGPDLHVERILTGVTCSNGIGWSPDDATMYFVDSGTNGIDAFDFDPGSGLVENRRRLVDVPPDRGLPDGLAVDLEGFVWVAIWGGARVHRYAPDGALDAAVALPAAQVTSCAFGGENLEELYVTSAAEGLTEADLRRQPAAGGVFRVRTGIAGSAPYSFPA